MRIAYDYHSAFNKGGIGEYINNLIRNFCLYYAQEFERIFLFYNSFRANFPQISHSFTNSCSLLKSRFPLFLLSRINKQLWWKVKYDHIYSYLSRKNNVNIFHGVEFVSLLSKQIRSVVTVHDLSDLINEKFYDKNYVKMKKKQYLRLCKYDKIISDSDSTKSDLTTMLKIPPEKIKVIYLGLDEHFINFSRNNLDEQKVQYIIRKYRLPQNYILYVGNFIKRKNVPTIVNIFTKYKKFCENSIKLVFVGNEYGNDLHVVKKMINSLRIQKDVLFLGFVDRMDLPYIYYNARLLLFIPYYEGFGLPVLEAMAVGTPTIISNNSALREIGREYAFFVNPEDDEDILQAIYKVINKPHLIENMRNAAIKYSKQFNWKKTAEQTLQLYKEILHQKH